MAEVLQQIQRKASEARATVRKTATSAMKPEKRVVKVGPTRGTIRTGTAQRELSKWEQEQQTKISQWETAQRLAVGSQPKAVTSQALEYTYEGLLPGEEQIARDYGIEEVNRRRRLAGERESISSMKETAVQLPSGEWVEKAEFGALPLEEQSRLRSLGIVGYNKDIERRQQEYEREKREYEEAQQRELERQRIERERLKQERERQEHEYERAQRKYERDQREYEEFTAEHIEIHPDEWIPKEEWNKLTPSQQKEVKATGSYTVTSEGPARPSGVMVGGPAIQTVTPEGVIVEPATKIVMQGEEWLVPSKEWDKLTPPQQQEYKETGEYTIYSEKPTSVEPPSTYKTGEGYDLVKMAGVYSSSQLEGFGFSSTDIAEAKKYKSDIETFQTKMKAYSDGEQYDLVGAIQGGVSSAYLSSYFGASAIQEAKEQVGLIETREDIERRLEPFQEKVESPWSIHATAPLEYAPNIEKALKEGVVTEKELATYGYKPEDIKRASTFADLGWKKHIPIYGTAATWAVSTPLERSIGVATDAFMVVPTIGWIGKAGAIAKAGLTAESVLLREAASTALNAGYKETATRYLMRATALEAPSLFTRASTIGKSALYSAEELALAPYSIAKGLLTQPGRILSGLAEATTFPFAHPLETLKGIGAVGLGKVPLGEPLIFQTARYISPMREYPPLTVSPSLGKTGVPRAPGGRTYESMIGAREAVVGLEAGARGPFMVEAPGLPAFEVVPSPYQRVFGPSMMHAGPSAGALRGGQIQLSDQGLYASPYFAGEFSYMSAGGTPGISHGGLIFPTRTPTYFGSPRGLRPGEITGPFRPMGGGAELEQVIGPRTWVSVGSRPEFGTRIFGQRVLTYPAEYGYGITPGMVRPTPASLRQRYQAKLLGTIEHIKHPLGGKGSFATYEVPIKGREFYATEWEGKLAGDVFDPKTGNILKTATGYVHPEGGLVRRRVTAVVIDKNGRILLGTDKMEPKGYFDLPGGRIDPKGTFGRTSGVEGISVEGSAHGQVKSEFGFGLKDVERLPIYEGQMNRHSLPGSYVVRGSPQSTEINLSKYQPKGKPTEIREALWWDGTTEIRVSPATRDILAGLNKTGAIRVDMSKVKIHSATPRELLASKARDTEWVRKITTSRIPQPTRTMSQVEATEAASKMAPEEAKAFLGGYRAYKMWNIPRTPAAYAKPIFEGLFPSSYNSLESAVRSSLPSVEKVSSPTYRAETYTSRTPMEAVSISEVAIKELKFLAPRVSVFEEFRGLLVAPTESFPMSEKVSDIFARDTTFRSIGDVARAPFEARPVEEIRTPYTSTRLVEETGIRSVVGTREVIPSEGRSPLVRDFFGRFEPSRTKELFPREEIATVREFPYPGRISSYPSRVGYDPFEATRAPFDPSRVPHEPFEPARVPFDPTRVPYESTEPVRVPFPFYTPYKPYKPVLPLPRGSSDSKGEELPEGTKVWQQGFVEKVIPPPFSGIKPYSNYNPVPKGRGSPYDTYRTIGRDTIEGEVDLGITDISFDSGIRFAGDGELTDVGKRHPSTTKGMTIRKKQPDMLRMR